MKKKNLFMALAAICAGVTFASCTNDLDGVAELGQLTDPTNGAALSITKVGTSEMSNVTRATATEVDEWATAPDKNIGVSAYSSTDGAEAMKTGSVNMKWTYNTGSSEWETETPLIMFPGEEGVITAYYPYGESVDPTAIDIDGTKDYMYALIGDNKSVNYGAPQTSLLMHHANAQLRVNLVRNGYAGDGEVTEFSIKGSKFASAAKLNSLTGVTSDYTALPEIAGNTGTLAEDVNAVPTAKMEAAYAWFVPVSDAAAPVTFDATVDGLKLRYTTSQQFLAGKRYTFNLAVTSSLQGELVLTSVEIDPWDDENHDGDMELNDPYNGHEYVDLGLPSGLKWAKYNVGAENETDPGLYFAWGETTGYENGSGHVFDNANYTASAISTNLTLAQDAANVNMGGSWRMPTKEDNFELCENGFAEWTANYDGTGKAGVIFYSCTSNATGKGYYNGAFGWKKVRSTNKDYTDASQPDGFIAYTLDIPHIFIPAVGYFDGSASPSLFGGGSLGCYWSSSWAKDRNGYNIRFVSGGVYPQNLNGRYCGMPVRGVCEIHQPEVE